ncbi:MAG: class I SAM-dependent methyltransferase [Candidatus Omnitrophota bacterium]
MLNTIKKLFPKKVNTQYEISTFTAEQYSQEERIRFLEAKISFLLDESYALKSLIRYLIADDMDKFILPQQTKDSFDFQWKHLPEGAAMLSSENWKEKVTETVCINTHLPTEWFNGKRVMDAGCGQGRWTYGFGKLNVASCVSFDISDNGVARTKEVVREFGGNFTVIKKNILEELSFSDDFDLVWCFGVLHHTGNTYKGFQNLVKCVKPGGYLFLMLYGEPRPTNIEDFLYYHEMHDMRCRIKNLPFSEKIERIEEKYGKDNIHGYFDAISPEINDLYRWDEIVSWLINAGFEDIKRTLPDHPNHHVIARKKI